MTTQLSVYNQALFLLKERRLTSIASGDSREKSQIELDVIWDDNAIDYCLEQALWNFATRRVQMSYDPDVTPSFGLQYAFSKPDDWIQTAAMCTDTYFHSPCLDYKDLNNYWLSDSSTLYLEYVSNDSSYGGDLSIWPQTFTKFVAAYLAKETCLIITGNENLKQTVDVEYARRLLDAKNKDATNQPTKFPASGNWLRSRAGNRYLPRIRN